MDLKARSHRFHDPVMHFLYGKVTLDKYHAIGFAEGYLPVFLPDAGMEPILFQLKPVLILPSLSVSALVAPPCPCERRLEPRQQQQGQIGLKIAAQEAMKFKNHLRPKLPPTPLIGLRRVGKAITENDLAGIESRQNDLSDSLCAVGKHEGHFRQRRKARGPRVEDKRADPVARSGAARLTGEDDVKRGIAFFKPGSQTLDLSGLTGTVKTFQGYE